MKCLSATDLPLSEAGRRQAALLGDYFADKDLTAVFSSPLNRCCETAEAVTKAAGLPEAEIYGDLRELDAGLWDGLSFDEIRQRWPEAHRRRGEDLANYRIPGGESFAEAGERFRACLDEVIAASSGDIAVFAHAGVIRACLCLLTGRPLGEVLELPQPFGGISTLRDEEGRRTVERIGWRPLSMLEETEAYERFQTPETVIAHMRATADYLSDLLDRLPGDYDRERLVKAALVHDIARTKPRHADAAADWLEKEGFAETAALVRLHQSVEPTDPETLTGADLLFYADKRLLGDKVVTVEERFAASREKCRMPEALEKHAALEEKARLIQAKIEKRMRA